MWKRASPKPLSQRSYLAGRTLDPEVGVFIGRLTESLALETVDLAVIVLKSRYTVPTVFDVCVALSETWKRSREPGVKSIKGLTLPRSPTGDLFKPVLWNVGGISTASRKGLVNYVRCFPSSCLTLS